MASFLFWFYGGGAEYRNMCDREDGMGTNALQSKPKKKPSVKRYWFVHFHRRKTANNAAYSYRSSRVHVPPSIFNAVFSDSDKDAEEPLSRSNDFITFP